MDHCALGRSEGAFPFALDGDLFQLFARDENAPGFREAAAQQEMTRAFTNLENRPEQNRKPFQHAAQRRERAKWETAKERFRQNAQDKKINRQRDQECEEKANGSELRHEQFSEDQQAEDVGEVRDEENGDEQALRPFGEPIQAQRCRLSLFHLMAQPDRIDGEQPGLDPSEEKRDNPEKEDRESVNHGAVAPLPSCSGSRQAVFSRRISSIRFRPARRIVTASRGISKRGPDGGK